MDQTPDEILDYSGSRVQILGWKGDNLLVKYLDTASDSGYTIVWIPKPYSLVNSSNA